MKARQIYFGFSFFIVGAFLLLFSGCQKQPNACFTSNSGKIYVGDAVSFSSCSTDAYEYEWDFGDGTTGSGSTASHIYYSAGNYIVTLTVSSKNEKKSDVTTDGITVYKPYGDVVFWLSTNTGYYYTDVTIDGVTKTITSDNTSTPDCYDSGCATFNLLEGTYSYYAEEEAGGSGYYWDGTVTVTRGGCLRFELY